MISDAHTQINEPWPSSHANATVSYKQRTEKLGNANQRTMISAAHANQRTMSFPTCKCHSKLQQFDKHRWLPLDYRCQSFVVACRFQITLSRANLLCRPTESPHHDPRCGRVRCHRWAKTVGDAWDTCSLSVPTTTQINVRDANQHGLLSVPTASQINITLICVESGSLSVGKRNL